MTTLGMTWEQRGWIVGDTLSDEQYEEKLLAITKRLSDAQKKLAEDRVNKMREPYYTRCMRLLMDDSGNDRPDPTSHKEKR